MFEHDFSIWINFLCANGPIPNMSTSVVAERLNIDAKELLVTQNGLYLLKYGEALPLNAVFADENGLYVIIEAKREDTITDTCKNGHSIYHYDCMGCSNWWCPFRCKCHSPWSSNQLDN